MFGLKKKKQTNDRPAGSGEPAISALLMEGDTFSFGLFRKHLSTARIASRTPADVNYDGSSILTFQLGDELFALALMPAPYPWSDLEGPCATSWMWPKETPAIRVKRHRSHVLMTMMGGQSNPVERRRMLTLVTALAAQQPGVMGIYWPEATLVHYPPVFIDMAKSIAEAGAPPLDLWVDYRLFQNPDGTIGLFTTGHKWLGHMEIEIPRIRMSPGELRDWAMNITNYLLEKGPVLLDGNTIGMTAEQKIRIHHLPSLFGRPDTVLRMEV